MEQDSRDPPRESCVPYFDALWFCYSPVYQMKEYYVHGTVDDCTGHWKKFYDCLKRKTRFKEDTEAPLKPAALWELRTKEEASEFWQQQFSTAAPATELSSDADAEQTYKPKPTMT